MFPVGNHNFSRELESDGTQQGRDGGWAQALPLAWVAQTTNSVLTSAEQSENTPPSVHFLIYVPEQDIF